MNELLIWLGKASFIMAVCAAFYLAFLRNRSFFQANRAFLLTSLLLSLGLPLIPVPQYSMQALTEVLPLLPVEESVPLSAEEALVAKMPISEAPQAWWAQVQWGSILLGIWILGALYMLSHLVRHVIRLKSLLSLAQPLDGLDLHIKRNPLIQSPLSFGRSIFLPNSMALWDASMLQQVITHEETHIRQFHRYDLFLLMGLRIFFWWNPFIYWYQRELRCLHEYLADQEVLRSTSLQDYGQTLIHFAQSRKSPQLAHAFAESPLKRRIQMMLKHRFEWRELWLFLPITMVVGGLWYGFIGNKAEPEVIEIRITEPLPVLQEVILEKEIPIDGSVVLEEIAIPHIEVLNQLDLAPLAWPIKNGEVLSAYGMRMHPVFKERKLHMGIDIRAKVGTPVYAAQAGVIEFAGTKDKNYGIVVDVDHPASMFGNEAAMTRYAHLDKVLVKQGQTVVKGQLIAHAGNSGVSKGPHLHFELRRKGKPINPQPYFKSSTSSSSNAYATARPRVEEVLMVAERMPEFPGGKAALDAYIQSSINYNAMDGAGRVYAKFIVGKNGELSNARIVKGISEVCDQEALRIISTMPQWKAGEHKGRKVPISQTLVFEFRPEQEVYYQSVKEVYDKDSSN